MFKRKNLAELGLMGLMGLRVRQLELEIERIDRVLNFMADSLGFWKDEQEAYNLMLSEMRKREMERTKHGEQLKPC
jgi:hypothetical protein